MSYPVLDHPLYGALGYEDHESAWVLDRSRKSYQGLQADIEYTRARARLAYEVSLQMGEMMLVCHAFHAFRLASTA